jgi:hypothetical protein
VLFGGLDGVVFGGLDGVTGRSSAMVFLVITAS